MEGYMYALSLYSEQRCLIFSRYACTPHVWVAATGGELSVMNVLR